MNTAPMQRVRMQRNVSAVRGLMLAEPHTFVLTPLPRRAEATGTLNRRGR